MCLSRNYSACIWYFVVLISKKKRLNIVAFKLYLNLQLSYFPDTCILLQRRFLDLVSSHYNTNNFKLFRWKGGERISLIFQPHVINLWGKMVSICQRCRYYVRVVMSSGLYFLMTSYGKGQKGWNKFAFTLFP